MKERGSCGRVTDSHDIAAAVAALRAGQLIGLPTETVYGVAADATCPAAVERIFEAKGRPDDRPLPLLLASGDELGRWAVDVPDCARVLAERFWPGPLTLVLSRGPEVSDAITAGGPTVGLRVPDHPLALAVLREMGVPLATPSANRHGGVSATSAAEVVAALATHVRVVLDGGRCGLGLESTVVACAPDRVTVLRRGALPPAALAAVLPSSTRVQDDGSGQTTRFVLRTEAELVGGAELADRVRHHRGAGRSVGVVSATEVGVVGLYAALAAADGAGHDILVVDPGSNEVARRVLAHRLRPRSSP